MIKNRDLRDFNHQKGDGGEKVVKTNSQLAKETFSEGAQTGVIISEDVRDYDKYRYVDFHIENKNQHIKVGYSLNVTHDKDGNPKSDLAKLLKRFGLDVTKNPDTNELVGKKVNFFVTTEDKDGKTYFVILRDSLNPNK